jgi:O-antigen ligase
MLGALALAPILIVGDVWDTERFGELRESPLRVAGLACSAVAAVGLLATLFLRMPPTFALLAVATLPFRVPIEIGGRDSNLLLPLYFVIAGGAVAAAVGAWQVREGRSWGGRSEPLPGVAAALPWLLAAFLALYAVQSVYSEGFSQALENICFFFVPFAVLLVLLLEVRWTVPLLAWLVGVVAVESLLFAAIGFVQYGTRELFWNPSVIAANEVHTYFRVNSLFWDPNVLGRYLALAVLALASGMVWARRGSRAGLAAGACAALILALTITYSQSSLAALLAGLVALAAMRWSARWALGVAATVLAAGAVFAAVSGIDVDLGSVRSLDVETSGRANLVRGGLELAADRPAFGYGSGSFQREFARHFRGPGEGAEGTVSHTEPITVAAEQGAVGLIVWLALVVWGVAALLRAAPGTPIARTALVACFAAMVVHSLAYAGFLIDPVTWALLGLGLAMSRRPPEPVAEAAPGAGWRALAPARGTSPA